MRLNNRIRGALLCMVMMTGMAYADDTAKTTGKSTPSSLHEVMQKGAQKMQSMPMSGDVDHDFMTAMRDHHMQAIEMTKVLLAQGKDAQARSFAKKTMEMQEKDLKEIDAWLAKHSHGGKTDAKKRGGHAH